MCQRIHFTFIIYKQFNFCRFRASAYTKVDRLCAVFMRMHGSALRCVRSDSHCMWNMANSPLCKQKTTKDIEKPSRIYHYAAESSCHAKFDRNRLTHFGQTNGEISVFFLTSTQTINQANNFFRLVYRSQITLQHGSANCCNGDAASQWEMVIFGMSELRNP